MSEASADRDKIERSGGGACAPSFENANYRAEMKARARAEGQHLHCRGPRRGQGEYHINDKYPYRFKLEDPPPQGIKYPKPIVGKEDGTMDQRKVVLKVPFISEASGDKKVAGTLSLSVCSAANCLMDKQPLEVTVKVE